MFFHLPGVPVDVGTEAEAETKVEAEVKILVAKWNNRLRKQGLCKIRKDGSRSRFYGQRRGLGVAGSNLS